MIGRRAISGLRWRSAALAAVTLGLASAASAEETLQTLRCDTELIISTSRGYHTGNKGVVLFDVVTDDARPTSFVFRVHPSLHPSIALKLRDCVTGSCNGPMTRDSFTLADRKVEGGTVRTIDIGRVNGEYTA
ncbi:MAG TPA: hypothetical protein VNR51_00390, partial [Hyphomicrobium sp.]|nr:hypothetical protein [Hyphomicrobium sp.]